MVEDGYEVDIEDVGAMIEVVEGIVVVDNGVVQAVDVV